MKAVLAFVFSLLVVSAAFAQLPDVGEQIFRSKDIRHLTEGCTLAYTIKDRHLYCASESSSETTTSHGAKIKLVSFEDDIDVVAGQTYNVGLHELPAGAVVLRCLTRTLSPITNGYLVGLDGMEPIFATATGADDETSEEDIYFVGPMPIYVDEPIRVTAPQGLTFPDSGKVRVSCFYYTFTAPKG